MTISDEAKAQVSQVLRVGDAAVDATMGNGWDTLFLAEVVGSEGKVYAFDVQKAALKATRKRLGKVDLLGHCELYEKGHEEMAEVVPSEVGAVMFNLGYLPYADRNVITKTETTLKALQQSASLLRSGGILTVICYRGHQGGPEEAQAVHAWGLQQEQLSNEGPQVLPEGEGAVLLVFRKKCPTGSAGL